MPLAPPFMQPGAAMNGIGGQVGALSAGLAPHFDDGGATAAPWYVRAEAREVYHPGGLIASSVPGRTDRLPIAVATNSYVMPADVVSGLGQGNTLAGSKVLETALKLGPYGTALPRGRGRASLPHPPSLDFHPQVGYAHGGSAEERSSIIAAGGEYVIRPEDVLRLGEGDMTQGHRRLDELVKRVRAHVVKRIKSLPAPKK